MKIGEFFSNLPVVETDRLKLRKLTREDSKDVFEYAQIKSTTEFLSWYPHRTEKDSLKFIDSVVENYNKGYVAPWGIELKEENKIIGTVGFNSINHINNCAEIGFVINEKYGKRGLASEAAGAVLDFGFAEMKLHRIEAHCDQNNEASAKLLERVGMTYEGTLRDRFYLKDRFVTVKLFSVLEHEYETNKQSVVKK